MRESKRREGKRREGQRRDVKRREERVREGRVREEGEIKSVMDIIVTWSAPANAHTWSSERRLEE